MDILSTVISKQVFVADESKRIFVLQRDPAGGAQHGVGHDAAREQARGRRLVGR